MIPYPRYIKRLSRRSGSSAMEYAFLMGLIAAVSLASFSTFGQKIADAFYQAQANISSLSLPSSPPATIIPDP